MKAFNKDRKCNAPRPTLQKTSSYSEFPVCFFCACSFIFALHHVIMPSCHLIFKTQLNKLHRSFDLFKPRELTWWLLFITYPPILGSYIKYFFISEITKTHLQNNFVPFLLQVWSPILPIIISSFSGAPPKIRTFLDLPKPSLPFKPIWIKFKWVWI